MSLGDDLSLEKGWLRESKSNLVSGELVVAVHNGINLLVAHDILVQWVEEDFGVLLAVHGHSGRFSGDVGGEHLKTQINLLIKFKAGAIYNN